MNIIILLILFIICVIIIYFCPPISIHFNYDNCIKYFNNNQNTNKQNIIIKINKIILSFVYSSSNLLIRLLKRLKYIVKIMPILTMIHFILFQLELDMIFQYPFKSIIWLYSFVFIHECGHCIVLFYKKTQFTLIISFYSCKIQHKCHDKLIHSSGIVFLYCILLLLSFTCLKDWTIIGLLLCCIDSLNIKGMDGYYCK